MNQHIQNRSKVLRNALEQGEVNIPALRSFLESVEKSASTPTSGKRVSKKRQRFERQLALLK